VKIRSFRQKILWALVGTVAVLTAVELALFTSFIWRNIQRKTEAELQTARAIFRAQQLQRFEKLQICTRLVGSRRLAAALEEGDAEVLLGVLQNEQEISKLEHTFLSVAGKDGVILARLGSEGLAAQQPGPTAPEHEFLAQSVGGQRGYFIGDGRIFEALTQSVRTEGDPLGSIMVAFVVEDTTARELAIALGYDATAPQNQPQEVEVGFLTGGKLVASTLPPEKRGRFQPWLKQNRFSVDGVPYVAFASPLTEGQTDAYHVVMISQLEWHQLIRKLWLGALVCNAFVLVLCFLVSSRLARGISAPVSELEAGAREIRQGNLGVRVQPRTHDELGRLARAFNEMADGLQLKEKYRGVLDKVVSPEVAEELLNGKIDLGGELRSVTVLFCDIRGFTPLTEGMEPHAVLAMLNNHMTAMTEIVRRHGGIVDKFVGDELMAVFGAPKSSGQDALSAARAACEMIAKRAELNSLPATDRRFEIGIGLNTGEVVAGNMGSDKQLSYTVLGKTVNLASRLCGAASPGQILASAATIEAAGPGITATPLDPVNVKGFSSAIHVFNVRPVQ
jgi:class 3 adenylate cyclase